MKVVKDTELINVGNFTRTIDYQTTHQDILDAIRAVVWPPGATVFTINPGKHINGVKPIKDAFLSCLKDKGWRTEEMLDIKVTRVRPGPIDAVKQIGDKYYAVEWETGNISSSHRALNKMVMGMLQEKLVGGTLVVSSANIYPFLTDRVGSYDELRPYFPLFQVMQPPQGVLSVIAFEHDATSPAVPPIGKGTDGRALR